MLFAVVTLETSHALMSPLNDVALWKMPFMAVTLETSHVLMSPLNAVALLNM
jgi:hypothetical protein